MDFNKIPFAEWLEQAAHFLLDMKASRIAIVAMDDDGETLTAYYNGNVTDMGIMADAIKSDEWLERLEANREKIKQLMEDDPDD